MRKRRKTHLGCGPRNDTLHRTLRTRRPNFVRISVAGAIGLDCQRRRGRNQARKVPPERDGVIRHDLIVRRRLCLCRNRKRDRTRGRGLRDRVCRNRRTRGCCNPTIK